ncbi:hypothetical protein CA51_34680 [Rosistilla oblonga]|uniref:Uncharacterized protein n=1 Tax=Rosistilla oblonga TaxID=2527990 RepID=A0A518IYS2_9BACT|nr:hypothetical protein [Rosistilla oblonga]QDV13578.1 hypothetical protein CA51_34680 [Rosistilla oblonga]QDV58230.1 hypothetical protein Mal33_42480 [Rosistilla oblonga]
MIDSFSIALALGPLAIYLMVIGYLQSARRPTVTTGAQDTIALAIGVGGFVLAGPLVLFFPTMAYGMLGWIVWMMLAVFFLLSLLLIILTMRPRMVIYGATADDVRGPLLRAAQSIDPGARLEGQQIWFPAVGTAVRLEVFSPQDTPQIVPPLQTISPVFWRRLVQATRRELGQVENASRFRGVGLLLLALVILGFVGMQIAMQPQEIVSGFREWLRL